METQNYRYKLFTITSPYKKLKVKKNLRVCPVCDNNPIMTFFGKMCRSCSDKKRIEEGVRNSLINRQELLKILESGEYTLEQVAAKQGVTRERIRQIWKKITGKGYRLHIKKVQELQKEKHQKWLNEVRFICLHCKRKVLNKEKNGWSFCLECRRLLKHKSRRNYRVILYCEECKGSFHPWSGYNSVSQNYKSKFCSSKCYFKSPDFMAGFVYGHKARFNEDKIINLFCDFYKKHNRMPRWSEMKTPKLGVSESTIWRYCGSFSKARLMALERLNS